MKFIGLDLAWSPKNPSGFAIIEGDKKSATLTFTKHIQTDEEFSALIEEHVGKEDAFVAVDAPLIVPNMGGRRPAEALVGSLFRVYNAGAHPSNRERLGAWNNGKVRGEEIVSLLEKQGFAHDPYIEKFEQKRKVFEVYPHPSMVVLFNLKKVIPYKSKPSRTPEQLAAAFKVYQGHMKALEKSKPSLTLNAEILQKDVSKLKGKQLKAYEDVLDAVFCAYLAYYAWANPDKCKVLGDMKEGYIITPVFDFMNKKLQEMNDQKSLGDF